MILFNVADWKVLAGKLKQLAVKESCEVEVQKLLNEYITFLSDKGVLVLSFIFSFFLLLLSMNV